MLVSRRSGVLYHARVLWLILSACLCVGWTERGWAEFLAYQVQIDGVSERSLLADLRSVSDSLKWKEKPPGSMGLLRQRAEGDVEHFLKLLRSAGYYGAEVSFSLDEDKVPPMLRFSVKAGEVFRIDSIEWKVPESESAILTELPNPEGLGLRRGEPARAQSVLDAEKLILQALKQNGRPFARVADRRVIVDHETRTMDVTFTLAPGPVAQFGPTTVNGLKSVREDILRNRFLWKQGDRFNANLISETEKELTQTELFSLVRFTLAEKLNSDGQIPLVLDVSERRHRSVKLGAGYKTDEGPGGKISWEHRNLLHNGEKLNLSLSGSSLSTAFDVSFKKPDFLHPHQTIAASSRLANDDTEAYMSRYAETCVALGQNVGKTFKWSLGPGFRWSRVEQLEDVDEFALLFVQSSMEWDRSDNLLDPTRGGRLKVQLAPFWGVLDTSLAFARAELSYSHYLKLAEHPSLILAGRAGFGSIVGADRDSIPPDQRFYAGGGGSIRGYPFQTVGPLTGKKPIGGSSLVEVSAELRLRVTREIGLVAFVDGGSAFESSFPDSDTDVMWGAGLGLRYHTPVGPLRLDVAVPLDKRTGVDDSFQVYVSIGQAF